MLSTFTAMSREDVGEKKKKNQIARDKTEMVVGVFTGILHIGLEEMYKFILLYFFTRGELVFLLRRPISVALLLPSHVFELFNFFSKTQRG